MNAHDRCLLLVASAIDFELSPGEKQVVTRHLAACPTCPREAAGLARDAATIAALPQPVRPASRPRSTPTRGPLLTFREPSLRLVLAAALAALLVLGALAAGGELVRRLEDSSRLARDPNPVAPLVADAARSPSPRPSGLDPSASSVPGATPAPACVAEPSLADLVANGGAWSVGCFGSRELGLVGYAPFGDGANVCEGWEPTWLSCPSGSFIATSAARGAPLLAYAHHGDVPIGRPADGPDSVDGQPINGHFLRFTGHFADPAAADCVAVSASAPLFNERATLQRQCRETFVVTAMALLVGGDVPRPVIDATWTRTVGPALLGVPPSTTLRSIVELDGEWFLLGFDDEQATSHLWSSPDGRTWQPVATDGYRLTGLAAGGDRLFGIGGADTVEVRTSTDGRTWTAVPGLPSNAEIATVAATSQGVFAGGGIGIDAAVWRFDKDLWNRVDLPDASGIQGGQDAAPAFVRGVTELGGRLSAYGDGPAVGGIGFGVARLWESKDGVSWGSADLPAADGSGALAGMTRSDGVGAVIVGSRVSEVGPSSWARQAGDWTSGAFPAAAQAPTASLREVIEVRGAVIAIGSRPSTTDAGTVATWGSSDGINWSPLAADEMDGGLANDVIVTPDGRVVAVGWQPAGAGGDAGPTIWELVPRVAP